MSESDHQQREHAWGELPAELRHRAQWVVTKSKAPVFPSQGWDKKYRQLPFEEAKAYTRQHGGELAFTLRPDDPFALIDFDKIGPPNALPDDVREWVNTFDTYTEISRSGIGLHLVCKGTRLPDRLEKGNLDCRGSVEVYDAGQYFVVTGNTIGSTHTITNGGEEFLKLQRKYLPKRTAELTDKNRSKENSGGFTLENLSSTSTGLRPIDIRRTVHEYATDGSKPARRTLHLWKSPASSDASYQSPSEADLALCSDLAFWCKEDARLIDQCFRESNRYRPKWDEIHYADGRTYGNGTVQTAVRSNYATYSADRYVIWD